MPNENAQAIKDADMRAAKARKDAQTGGTDAPMPDDIKQEIADRKAREAATNAPTTKTQMGKPFKSGGSVSSASKRADGCATKGKTRGMMV